MVRSLTGQIPCIPCMTPAPACQCVCVCICVRERMVLPGTDQTGRKFKCLCPDGKTSYASNLTHSVNPNLKLSKQSKYCPELSVLANNPKLTEIIFPLTVSTDYVLCCLCHESPSAPLPCTRLLILIFFTLCLVCDYLL